MGDVLGEGNGRGTQSSSVYNPANCKTVIISCYNDVKNFVTRVKIRHHVSTSRLHLLVLIKALLLYHAITMVYYPKQNMVHTLILLYFFISVMDTISDL